jgi:LPS-assembly lipoprotein
MLAATAAMAGCTFRPLYADATPAGGVLGISGGADRGIGRPLSRIAVAELPTREGIALRNDLIFLLGGGGAEPVDPEYRLDVALATISSPLAVQAVSGLATTASATVTASYSLVRLRDGARVYTAGATARATFDRGVQRFANIRAERDAFDRATRELAEMIRIGLAAHFARAAAG